MAMKSVEQREIVEIPFVMPDGSVLPHPALVISRDELQLDENGMFYAVLISTKNYHPEYTIKIQDEWLNKPLVQVICHLSDILSLSNTEKGRAYGSSFFCPYVTYAEEAAYLQDRLPQQNEF